MRFFLAVTDDDRFSYMAAAVPSEEVIFWQRSGNVQFQARQPGEPFLFKVHSPIDYIIGGGFFGHFSILPVNPARETFGQNNGAEAIQEMRERVENYRESVPSPGRTTTSVTFCLRAHSSSGVKTGCT
jgi:putative restriction endonuclease